MIKWLKNGFRFMIVFALLCVSPIRANAISGGEYAPPRAFPFMVSIKIIMGDSYGLCGGTLIASQWVLTAAHCVVERNIKKLVVYTGSDNQWQGQAIEANRWVVHPNYDAMTHDNDVALIQLSVPPSLSGKIISSVRLAASANQIPDGSSADIGSSGDKSDVSKRVKRDITVVGWGKTVMTTINLSAEDKNIIPGTSLRLKALKFRIANREYCNKRAVASNINLLKIKLHELSIDAITKFQILSIVSSAPLKGLPAGAFCGSSSVDMFGEPTKMVAGIPSSNICMFNNCLGPTECLDPECTLQYSVEFEPSNCQGDSGGPVLFKEDDGAWTQVGLVSYGAGNDDFSCGMTAVPNVYTNVGAYNSWIQATIKPR